MTDFDPIQSLINNAAIHDHNVEVAATHVLRYWDAMNAVEKRFIDQSDPDLQEVIAAKTEVHERFWMPTDDNYWKPCSHGSDEEFRVADIADVVVLSDFRISFIVRLVIRDDCDRFGKSDIVYLLQTQDRRKEGAVWIVNEFS
ncbi:hypothetical protein Poly51_63220 [Rubripirellula tenax]|uniref:Uncharacterized protein n=1 Tax=Rubripirellula tenax TaxID=2528015 RepID=A0A5C6E440_9BACT|nr:hypothetical protein [Rubripirellula tenax]TWU43580.1 hypothetical protein Poly51_63220 [Rubripirellula tenax]